MRWRQAISTRRGDGEYDHAFKDDGPDLPRVSPAGRVRTTMIKDKRVAEGEKEETSDGYSS